MLRVYRSAEEELLERLDSSEEEYFPIGVVSRLLAQENPITIYREYRGMSREELAKAADTVFGEVAEMESGSRAAPVGRVPAVAKALGFDCDDLV